MRWEWAKWCQFQVGWADVIQIHGSKISQSWNLRRCFLILLIRLVNLFIYTIHVIWPWHWFMIVSCIISMMLCRVFESNVFLIFSYYCPHYFLMIVFSLFATSTPSLGIFPPSFSEVLVSCHRGASLPHWLWMDASAPAILLFWAPSPTGQVPCNSNGIHIWYMCILLSMYPEIIEHPEVSKEKILPFWLNFGHWSVFGLLLCIERSSCRTRLNSLHVPSEPRIITEP